MTDPTAQALLAAAIRYGEACRDLHGGPPGQLHPSLVTVHELLKVARKYTAQCEAAAAKARGEEA